MRKRVFIPVALMAVAAMAFSVVGFAAEGDKVTGGGQVLNQDEDGNDVGGAGDTIAFNARGYGEEDEANGQVQYVDREIGQNGKGTGKGQEVLHGIVECLVVLDRNDVGGSAILAGHWTKGGSGDFEIYVRDNGEGGDSEDQIIVNENPVPDSECEEDDDEDYSDPFTLARGNVQVHKAPAE